jgi:hypothetical protein
LTDLTHTILFLFSTCETTYFDSMRRSMFFQANFGIAIAFSLFKEGSKMANETDSSDTPKLQDDSTDVQKSVQEKLSRIANKAAKRAAIRQQHYDAEHGIFTR